MKGNGTGHYEACNEEILVAGYIIVSVLIVMIRMNQLVQIVVGLGVGFVYVLNLVVRRFINPQIQKINHHKAKKHAGHHKPQGHALT